MALNPQELKGLIDSTPQVALLLNLPGYYANRQLPEKGVDSEVVYDCPRTQMMIRTAVKGTHIGNHFHTVSDEIVIVVGGRGEILVNGEWKPVKPGDQLRFEVDMVQLRGKVCRIAGVAKVDGQVVCEAEMAAMVRDR